MIGERARNMLTRRSTLTLFAASGVAPVTALAASPKEVMWDDLIPPGVPYSEIIGEGEIDVVNDTWLPIFDQNARKLNTALEGLLIRMPGYIIPFELSSAGVTEFMLVPYIGACIHVPPPPPNQLVYVTTEQPWPNGQLWEAIWVTGVLSLEFQTTDIATVGYSLRSEHIEPFEW